MVALKHFDVKPNESFTNNGTFPDGTFAGEKGPIEIKLNGEFVPHSILLHPPSKGYSQVSYPLGGKWTGFRATVGIPNIGDKNGEPNSPIAFEVIGDGNSLWKSETVDKIAAFQTCSISVQKVKTLTLRVHCPEKSNWAIAFWFEPILAE